MQKLVMMAYNGHELGLSTFNDPNASSLKFLTPFSQYTQAEQNEVALPALTWKSVYNGHHIFHFAQT
jgi:hypothetical protein